MAGKMNWKLQVTCENEVECEKINNCIKYLERDADAQAALERASSLEEMYAVLKNYITDTFEVYKARVERLIAQLKEEASNIEWEDRELSDT